MSKRAVRLNGQPAVNGTTSASNRASDETIDGTATPSARNVEAGDTHDADDASLTSVEALQPGLGFGSSGVYVVKREHAQHVVAQQNAHARAAQAHDHDEHAQNAQHAQDEIGRRTVMMNPLLEHVTLVVYGWHNVEPGTLSWVFPSVTAAVAAARAMKNAVRWAIVAGRREASDDDLIDARAHGAVLIEQAG